jgi:hypothetical protein
MFELKEQYSENFVSVELGLEDGENKENVKLQYQEMFSDEMWKEVRKEI